MRIGTAVEDVGGRDRARSPPPSSRSRRAPQRAESDIAEVAAVAEQSSASAEQVSASTQQTCASTQEIAASAQDLARTAEELDALVAHFKVTVSAGSAVAAAGRSRVQQQRRGSAASDHPPARRPGHGAGGRPEHPQDQQHVLGHEVVAHDARRLRALQRTGGGARGSARAARR